MDQIVNRPSLPTDQPMGNSVAPLAMSKPSKVPVIINKPRSADILHGRGLPFQMHPGNRRLHEIADLYKTRYLNARRNSKRKIVAAIIDHVHDECGGRFLKLQSPGSSGKTKVWIVATVAEAREKVAHTIRSRSRETVPEEVVDICIGDDLKRHFKEGVAKKHQVTPEEQIKPNPAKAAAYVPKSTLNTSDSFQMPALAQWENSELRPQNLPVMDLVKLELEQLRQRNQTLSHLLSSGMTSLGDLGTIQHRQPCQPLSVAKNIYASPLPNVPTVSEEERLLRARLQEIQSARQMAAMMYLRNQFPF